MFLVTTADRRFWRSGERTLFLGEWCRLQDQRHAWAGLDSEVLPYHWDDRRRLHRDQQYAKDVYERYLSELVNRLNAVHGVHHSTRYWRIVAGRWLRYFVEILLDRYLSIAAAYESGKVTTTCLDGPMPGTWTPQDFPEFHHWFLSDQYNQFLYGQLIRLDGRIPFEEISAGPREPIPTVALESPSRVKRAAKRLLWGYARAIPARWNRVLFVESHLSRTDLVRLQLRLRQWPSISTRLTTSTPLPYDGERRSALRLTCGQTPFERVLDCLIPIQIPRSYIEGYAESRKRALSLFPRRPKVIFTANAYSSYEAFKLWAAEETENGAKLAIWQHGGIYGTALWCSTEDHERAIADRYYTWGWNPEKDPKLVPVCGGQLARLRETLEPDPAGPILWVAMSAPRYAYWMHSGAVGPAMSSHLADQRRFLATLSADARRHIVLRLFPQEFGWQEISRWAEWAPDLKTSRGGTTMYEQLSRSRLMVATYNSTTYLETFAAGFPTIMFWDPQHWELRRSAQPYFDALRSVGILHDTPESAAAKVSEVWTDPRPWWQSAAVRSVRSTFCEEFVRLRPTWLTDLRDDLRALCES